MHIFKLDSVIRGFSFVAIAFGVVTIISGGNALYHLLVAPEAGRKIVSFVLYFNFFAGFVYIASGMGLLKRRRWAFALAMALAAANLVILGGLGLWISAGNPYETRTVFAMSLRTAFWLSLAAILCIQSCRGHNAR